MDVQESHERGLAGRALAAPMIWRHRGGDPPISIPYGVVRSGDFFVGLDIAQPGGLRNLYTQCFLNLSLKEAL